MEKATDLEKIKIMHKLADAYMNVYPDSAICILNTALDLSKSYNIENEIIKSLLLIGKFWLVKSNNDSALYYLLQGTQRIQKDKYKYEYANSLQHIANIYYQISNYKKSREYYKKIFLIAKNHHLIEQKALAIDGIGTSYSGEGNYERALEYHLKSLKIYEKILNVKKIIRLNYIVGSDLANLGIYDNAIEYLLKSLQLAQEKNNMEYISYCNHAMGIIYGRLKNYQAAIKYNLKALKVAKYINDYFVASNIYQDIGEIYYELAYFDSSLSYLNKSLEIRIKSEDNVGIALSLHGIGKNHYKQSKYRIAKKYIDDAWKIIEKSNVKHIKAEIQNSLGEIYIKLKNYDKANKFLIKSKKNIKTIKSQNLVQKNLRAFSEYYVAIRDYKNAYKSLKLFSDLRDSITTQSSHNIAEMQMRYEMGKREKEKKILLNKIHIQGLEIEQSRLERWLSVLTLILFSIVSIWGYGKLKVNKRSNVVLENRIDQALKEKDEQQKIIFHQASLSSLGELAASMAHEIKQPLQNLKLCAEYVELMMREADKMDDSLIKSLEEIYQDIERISQIIDHMRVFSSLQKSNVNKLFNINSVIDYALSLVAKQCSKNAINLNLDLNKRISNIKGNPYKLEQVLINILTNARDAILAKENKLRVIFEKQIDIRTYNQDNQNIIEIKDNGIGIKPEMKEVIFQSFFTTKELGEGTGLGLSIVKEIVEEFNGKILIDSEYKKGTTVRIFLHKYSRTPTTKKYKRSINNSSKFN
jgi:signal transduction histidine kinase